MREIFSVRFFAAVGAVVGLFFLLSTVFAAREVIDGGGDAGTSDITSHRIDLVAQVDGVDDRGFVFDDDGLAAVSTRLTLDGEREIRIVEGTPGVDLCPDFPARGECALVADLLGDGVVWFAFVPMGENAMVPMPAIDTLVDGDAHLVNGWQVRYAPVLDRRCVDPDGRDVDFASYREFREVLGDDFTSLFSLQSQRLEAVVCHERVAYAPTVTTVPGDSPVPGGAATTVPGDSTLPGDTSATTVAETAP